MVARAKMGYSELGTDRRKLALAPLVEVTGPEVWSRITGQRSATAVEGLQNAPVWLVALGLAAFLLLLGVLLRRGVGYLAGAQRGAAKPEAKSRPNVSETAVEGGGSK